LRVAFAHQIRVTVAQIAELAINLTAPSALGNNSLQIRIAGRADPHPQPVVREDVEFFDVIDSPSAHHGVCATGIVSDHAPEGALLVRRRVWSESQVMMLGSIIQIIVNDSRFDVREFPFRIEPKQPVKKL